jgi:SAM-dependent methyltransferase
VPFDLTETLRELAGRNLGQTEADIQALIQSVLLYGDFALDDPKVRLESPSAGGKRIDIAVGAVIIECKRDLRPAGTLASAEQQLAGYLKAKAAQGETYAGLLTDGTIWRLYRYDVDGLAHVDTLTITPAKLDVRKFRRWLGAILATEQHLAPTADAINERLGAESPSYRLARAALLNCWESARHLPAVRLKREMWAKMLHSALGTQVIDSDALFVEHTYLVVLATLIGHTVIGFSLDDASQDAATLLSGGLFEQNGIVGPGDLGFFDWLGDVPAGIDIVADIARRVTSFSWANVNHDVLKALYHSVISATTRHELGEYYTPDWLAQRMVETVIRDPLTERVLDPSCGSGTFLFHAVRRYLAAAEAAGTNLADALTQVTGTVFGIDLHPVAVKLAQVTYLLAIGPQRLQARADTLTIPVYLGDSMAWDAPARQAGSTAVGLFNQVGDVVIDAWPGGTLMPHTLRFPAGVVADVDRFDDLVGALTARATDRPPGSPHKPVAGILQRFAISGADRNALTETYRQLCILHDNKEDHIWAFFVRNQARPTWLTLPPNRADVLIGNPPWLSYRYMPPKLQQVFESQARERNLWAGGARGRSAQLDLAGFFVARCVERYLRVDGRFGFVMPRAALSRQTYGRFHGGDWPSTDEQCHVEFDHPWDLDEVVPAPFKVPSAVIFGTRRDAKSGAMPATVVNFSGRPPIDRSPGTLVLARGTVQAMTGREPASIYKERFRNGAILYPRSLVTVVDSPNPLPSKTRRRVTSRRSTLEKQPWKDTPSLTGTVESIFVRPVYLGESIAPFRVLGNIEGVIPLRQGRPPHGRRRSEDRSVPWTGSLVASSRNRLRSPSQLGKAHLGRAS